MADSTEKKSLVGQIIKTTFMTIIVAFLAAFISLIIYRHFYNPTEYEFEVKHYSYSSSEKEYIEVDSLSRYFVDSGDKYRLKFTTKKKEPIKEISNALMKFTLSKITNELPKDYSNNYIHVFHLKGKDAYQLFPTSINSKNKSENINCALKSEKSIKTEELVNNPIQIGTMHAMECNFSCKEDSIGDEIYFLSSNEQDQKKLLGIDNRKAFLDFYKQQTQLLGYTISPLVFNCKAKKNEVSSLPRVETQLKQLPINCNNINNVNEFSKCINGIKESDFIPVSSLGLKYAAHTKKNGFKVPLELSNGIQLHSGDQYDIEIHPSINIYTYIYLIDAKGQFSNAITDSNYKNLIEFGKTLFLPSKGNSFTLDEDVGVEKIYIIAFNAPQPVFDYFNKQLALDKQRTSTETIALQKTIENFFEHTFKQLTDVKIINHLP